MRLPSTDAARAWLLATVSLCCLAGCVAASLLETRPGRDISPVRADTPRAQVEAVLGAPLRQWLTANSITYCLYQYNGGLHADAPAAIGMALADVASLGICDLARLAADEQRKDQPDACPFLRPCGKPARIIVSHTVDGTVLGTFTETDALPADGRPGPEPNPPPGPAWRPPGTAAAAAGSW